MSYTSSHSSWTAEMKSQCRFEPHARRSGGGGGISSERYAKVSGTWYVDRSRLRGIDFENSDPLLGLAIARAARRYAARGYGSARVRASSTIHERCSRITQRQEPPEARRPDGARSTRAKSFADLDACNRDCGPRRDGDAAGARIRIRIRTGQQCADGVRRIRLELADSP